MTKFVEISSVLSQLNRQQRAAASHLHGPLLVLAGAGTGKTRVITTRIANLLAHGIEAKCIVAVSFTRKAGNEMKERLYELVGSVATRMQVSTFHSLGLMILREEYEVARLKRRFEVCSAGEQLEICAAVHARMEPQHVEHIESVPRDLLRSISRAKNTGREANNLIQSKCPQEQALGFALESYNHELSQRQLIDLDDMVGIPVRILEGNAAVRDKFQRRYRHLLVDEYQDSNLLQNRFMKCLLNSEQNICVVGDDDQSIYGFRGARRELILGFPREFRRACVMKLTTNYRCSRQIVQVANAVIKESRGRRYGKRLVASKASMQPVRYVRLPDEMAERRLIATEIAAHRRAGSSYCDIAVLVRIKADSDKMRNELGRVGIPCGLKTGGVQIMTLHAAKGLEFPVVYLPGLNEGTLPHWNANQAGLDEVEEERRLFYVGVTRAAKQLTLLSSERRGSYASSPSRFIQTLLKRRLVESVSPSL